jgi:hypothetical protein
LERPDGIPFALRQADASYTLGVPHAVHATEASRMLLIMLREQVGA